MQDRLPGTVCRLTHLSWISGVEGIENEPQNDEIRLDKGIGKQGDQQEELGLVAGHQQDFKGDNANDCNPDGLAHGPQICDAVAVPVGHRVVGDEEADCAMDDGKRDGGPPEGWNRERLRAMVKLCSTCTSVTRSSQIHRKFAFPGAAKFHLLNKHMAGKVESSEKQCVSAC